MITRLHGWWRSRTLREQKLLLVAGALVSSMILWFGIWRPIDGALVDARKRHERAVLALADARSQADAIRVLGRVAPSAMSAPLLTAIGQLAGEAGFTVTRIEPQSARQVNLVLSAVRGPALFTWVSELERRHGLIVDRLSARANSDATLAVEISLRARGR